MELLFLIGIGVAIYWLSKKPNANNTINYQTRTVDDLLSERNAQWIDFIKSYDKVAKSASAKALIQRMLSDADAQGLGGVKAWNMDNGVVPTPPAQPNQTGGDTTGLMPQQPYVSSAEAVRQSSEVKHQVKLDNASLLLYFGAFLFVSSVGLFIGFAGVNGIARTFAVAFLALVFYFGGVWLFKTKKALQPAGLAFAGIGIAVTPLIGVAAYNFLWKGNPEAVWFGTSLLSMMLYAHALVVLRRPLINYVFIFTILSLFESAVSIINAPVYYFGWVMAFTGIILLFVSRIKSSLPELQESYRASGQLFVPLSVFVSFVLIANEGLGQLGVSLLLGALFYGMEAYFAEDEATRVTNTAIAHGSAVGGIASLAYAASDQIMVVALVLLVINLIHIIVIAKLPKNSLISYNFASIALVGLIAALGLGIESAVTIQLVLLSAIMTGLTVWFRQSRADGYAISGIALTALPIVFSRVYLEPALSYELLTVLLYAAWILQILLYVFTVVPKKEGSTSDTGRILLLLTAAVVFSSGALAGVLYGFITGAIVAVTIFILSEKDKGVEWEVASGMFAAAPIVVSVSNPNILLGAMVFAVLFNIGLALLYRSEVNRWLSTILWLILPLGMGAGALGSNWAAEAYAWSYVLVMACLILSRAIARGSLFVSAKIPLAAYAKTASLSYVYGYCFAAAAAVVISLSSTNSQLHTSLILGLLSVVALGLSYVVEQKKELLAMQPLLWQGLLLSIMRPDTTSTFFGLYLIASTTLASGAYVLARARWNDSKKVTEASTLFLSSALITTLITPASFFFVGDSHWFMAVGLMVFGAALLDYWRLNTQTNREIAVGVIVSGVMWLLYIAGVEELQAYTHIIAVMFAGFAYWRHKLGQMSESDGYLIAMLSVATIPLLLQALGGESGDIYGWWLLLEQIAFMLLGMLINKPAVTKWGLYVAVGAVLYQLRDLGFAALAFLGLFIIGVAVYQLQKYNQDPPTKN